MGEGLHCSCLELLFRPLLSEANWFPSHRCQSSRAPLLCLTTVSPGGDGASEKGIISSTERSAWTAKQRPFPNDGLSSGKGKQSFVVVVVVAVFSIPGYFLRRDWFWSGCDGGWLGAGGGCDGGWLGAGGGCDGGWLGADGGCDGSWLGAGGGCDGSWLGADGGCDGSWLGADGGCDGSWLGAGGGCDGSWLGAGGGCDGSWLGAGGGCDGSWLGAGGGCDGSWLGADGGCDGSWLGADGGCDGSWLGAGGDPATPTFRALSALQQAGLSGRLRCR